MHQPKQSSLFLIAPNIRSLYNVGCLFRAADVFAVDKIYLTGYTPDPASSKRDNGDDCRHKKQISKTALGAEEWIPWEKHQDTISLLKKLKAEGVSLYALETGPETKNLNTFKPKFPCALILGSEIEGVDDKILELADETISILLLGKKSSLNVAVAASVALYEFNRSRITP